MLRVVQDGIDPHELELIHSLGALLNLPVDLQVDLGQEGVQNLTSSTQKEHRIGLRVLDSPLNYLHNFIKLLLMEHPSGLRQHSPEAADKVLDYDSLLLHETICIDEKSIFVADCLSRLKLLFEIEDLCIFLRYLFDFKLLITVIIEFDLLFDCLPFGPLTKLDIVESYL